MSDTEKAALERRIDELCQENERLRNQLHDQQDTAEHNFVRNAREYKRVCDENTKLRSMRDTWQENDAKLRELSSIMLKCIMANERKALICWECPMHKRFDELRWFCCLKHEAKELGIEVPS